MGEEVQVLDWQRMFIGDMDLTFLLEIALRTSVIYLFAFALIRLLGKRGQGQLSPFEFVIIIALGSAVGDPMIYADVPLLYSMAVVAIVVFFNRSLVWLTERSDSIETFVDSKTACLVADGRIDLQTLKSESVTSDELFMSLRLDGIEQLGQVKRAYLETSGRISCYNHAPSDVRPGLPIYPTCDQLHVNPLPPGTHLSEGVYACSVCGETLQMGGPGSVCPRCQNERWVPALDFGTASDRR
jgi:uncharacterized membrane protein YcaP (DUF421 family)